MSTTYYILHFQHLPNSSNTYYILHFRHLPNSSTTYCILHFRHWPNSSTTYCISRYFMIPPLPLRALGSQQGSDAWKLFLQQVRTMRCHSGQHSLHSGLDFLNKMVSPPTHATYATGTENPLMLLASWNSVK